MITKNQTNFVIIKLFVQVDFVEKLLFNVLIIVEIDTIVEFLELENVGYGYQIG